MTTANANGYPASPRYVIFFFSYIFFYFTKGSLTTRLRGWNGKTMTTTNTRPYHLCDHHHHHATTNNNNDNDPTATDNDGSATGMIFFLLFFCFTNDYLQLQATYMYGTGLQEPQQQQQNHNNNNNEWPPPPLPTPDNERGVSRRYATMTTISKQKKPK
jgi:hypothetical protein